MVCDCVRLEGHKIAGHLESHTRSCLSVDVRLLREDWPVKLSLPRKQTEVIAVQRRRLSRAQLLRNILMCTMSVTGKEWRWSLQ